MFCDFGGKLACKLLGCLVFCDFGSKGEMACKLCGRVNENRAVLVTGV